MSFYEYWIGKSIDLEGLWDDFENGQCYIEKYKTMRVHLLRLTFNHYTPDLPLFNHEAISKTVKDTFHDLKRVVYQEMSMKVLAHSFCTKQVVVQSCGYFWQNLSRFFCMVLPSLARYILIKRLRKRVWKTRRKNYLY